MEFEFEGRIYKVGRRTFEVEDLFKRWLERNALSVIQRHADAMNPIQYQTQMDNWVRDCAAEVYDFEAYHSMVALNGRAGQKEIAYLTLAAFNRESPVRRDVVERLVANATKWAEFCAIQRAVNADPNSPAPKTEAGASENKNDENGSGE
jgi:hypothetical protein